MGLLQNLVKKWKEKKEEKSDYERQQRMMEGFEMRKLSSNERELMKFQKEEREKDVKSALEKFREKERERVWRGKEGNPINAPNITVTDKDLFKGNKNLFLRKSELTNRSIFLRK